MSGGWLEHFRELLSLVSSTTDARHPSCSYSELQWEAWFPGMGLQCEGKYRITLGESGHRGCQVQD